MKKKIKFIGIFVFLTLMLFLKPDDVRAAKVVGPTVQRETVTDVEQYQNPASTDIIYSSTELGFFRMGYKADLLESGSAYGNADDVLNEFTSGIEGNKFSTSNNDNFVMKYPDIMMFRQTYTSSNGKKNIYAVTGYMYLYVSSRDYEEYQKLFSSYAENKFPLYFSGKGQRPEIFYSVPAFFGYFPMSSIPVKGKPNMVYGQNYVEQNLTAIRKVSGTSAAKGLMEEICSQGKQDVNDWSSVSGQRTVAIGSEFIPLEGKYAWSLIFSVSAMGENTWDQTGVDFIQSPSNEHYDISKDVLIDAFNHVKGLLPESEKNAIIQGNPNLGYSGNFRGFKSNTQTIGLDRLVKENSTALDLINSNRKYITRDGDHLLNGEKLLQHAYNFIKSAGGGYNNVYDGGGHTNSAVVRYKLEQSQINSIYTAARAGTDTSFNAAILNVNGMQVVNRYTWGAQAGNLAGNFDFLFPRDVDCHATQSSSQNASDIVGRKLPNRTNPATYFKTKSFGHFATDNWGQFSDADKIQSTLVMIQFDPWYVPLFFTSGKGGDGPTTIGGLKFNGTATDVENLNKLGETNYTQWKKTIKRIGAWITSNSSTSSLSSTGWNSASAFANSPYYSMQNYGISLCFTSEDTKNEVFISNSYSQGIDTSLDGYGSLLKSSNSRTLVDWGDFSTAGLNLTGLTKGGTSHPEATNTDIAQKDQYYDIYTGIPTIPGSGQLAPDTDNVAAVSRSAGAKGSNNQTYIKKFAENPSAHPFRTVFFVGRTPESDSEVEVKVGDMVPTVFASFNKFDLVWDAGYDDNASGRATVSINMSENKGTAQSALSSAIYAFSGDYNGSYLVNNYWAKGLSKSYNEVHNWEFGVTANPIGIRKCNQKSIQSYAISEYALKGPEATGYSEITFDGGFVGANSETKVNPGDVIAYSFDYAFPKNQDVLKSNIGRLIEDGTWYTEYETLLMADLNIELLPSKKLKESEWEDINSNTGNDWVKERLVAPVLHNVFFTEVSVDSAGGESFTKTGRQPSEGADIISQTKLDEYDFGIPWLIAPEGKDEYNTTFDNPRTFKYHYDLKPNKSTTNYSLTRATVKCKWEYVTTLPIIQNNVNLANRIDWTNGFNRTYGTISGSVNDEDKTGKVANHKGYTYNGNVLTVRPNEDILNFGKGNTMTLSVPNSKVNEFHNDWEEIVISFSAPPKDNSVDDLVLLYNNSQLVGEANINRLNGGGAQAIDYKEGGSYTLYAIVRRNKPDFSWEEKVDGRKWRGDTVGCFEYATNENTSSHSKMVSHAETSIPGAARTIPIVIRNITSFKNPGDTLIFKVNLPSNLMYLEATFHYRDAYVGEDSEDIDLENNVWSESWSAKYPDFAVAVSQDFKSVFEKGGCGAQRTVVPNYTITATQANPFYEGGGGPVTIETSLDGWTVASGTTSGNRITWYWNGQMSQQDYHITYKERRFPYQSPTFNQEFVFRAHINPEVKYNEKNLNNNYAKANFSVTLDCQGGPTSPIEPCTPEDWERLGCKYNYGVGKQYRWNVKFAWSQQNPEKTTSTNVYVQHYMEDVYGSDGNGGSIYLGQREVCPCYCDPSPVTGPNNGVRFWRTEIDGAPLYYEVHDLRIYLKSTNKSTQWGWEGASVYDITRGTGYVSGGMMWNVFFDAIYNSDRGSMPRSMYSPFSQPYATGNGGSGCPTCNWLNRWPNPENVAGPRHVRIYYRGLQVIAPKTYEYDSPQQVLANGLVNKHFRWQPISGMMAMTKENTRQTLNISIKSFGFTGHIYDTWNSVDGTGWSPPGYAWQNSAFHCFCDTVSATVEFIPPRPYIASSVSPSENAQGLDGNVPGKGEKVENRDTGVEGTDNMEVDNINNYESSSDQWVY